MSPHGSDVSDEPALRSTHADPPWLPHRRHRVHLGLSRRGTLRGDHDRPRHRRRSVGPAFSIRATLWPSLAERCGSLGRPSPTSCSGPRVGSAREGLTGDDGPVLRRRLSQRGRSRRPSPPGGTPLDVPLEAMAQSQIRNTRGYVGDER
jgi:hypothetical protein